MNDKKKLEVLLDRWRDEMNAHPKRAVVDEISERLGRDTSLARSNAGQRAATAFVEGHRDDHALTHASNAV
jgi:hypothetical protein